MIFFKNENTELVYNSNGSGDPICIDTAEQSQIVYLNHDNYFEKVFINTSILQFAVCLTRYSGFIISIIDKSRDNFMRRKFTDTEFKQLKSNFEDIERRSLLDKSFWVSVLDGLQWERDNE
jgi:hypothetical protein